MKRILCLLWILCLLQGVQAQDFAAKFMELCTEKDDVQCQTVSPKMMEKLVTVMTNSNENKDEEVPSYLLSKLKSARIITATRQGKKLYRKAQELMENNKNRFTPWAEDALGKDDQIFVRKHGDTVRELVMFNLASEQKTFTVVNFTGDMDKHFMDLLSSGTIKENN
ncbi:MAG: DUF4252 domain-containing protein [Paraprevotella sp.]|nr:DUF4252 domain-containing protein [Paraprevotella sp.]